MDFVNQNKFPFVLGALTYSSFLRYHFLINFPMSALFESILIGGTGVFFMYKFLPDRFKVPTQYVLLSTIGINLLNKISAKRLAKRSHSNSC
jgi:hypothetical protein